MEETKGERKRRLTRERVRSWRERNRTDSPGRWPVGYVAVEDVRSRYRFLTERDGRVFAKWLRSADLGGEWWLSDRDDLRLVKQWQSERDKQRREAKGVLSNIWPQLQGQERFMALRMSANWYPSPLESELLLEAKAEIDARDESDKVKAALMLYEATMIQSGRNHRQLK